MPFNSNGNGSMRGREALLQTQNRNTLVAATAARPSRRRGGCPETPHKERGNASASLPPLQARDEPICK